jgi:hypothetical protein
MDIPLFTNSDARVDKDKKKKKRKHDVDILNDVVAKIDSETLPSSNEAVQESLVSQPRASEPPQMNNSLIALDNEDDASTSAKNVPLKLYIGGIGSNIKKCHLEVK